LGALPPMVLLVLAVSGALLTTLFQTLRGYFCFSLYLALRSGKPVPTRNAPLWTCSRTSWRWGSPVLNVLPMGAQSPRRPAAPGASRCSGSRTAYAAGDDRNARTRLRRAWQDWSPPSPALLVGAGRWALCEDAQRLAHQIRERLRVGGSTERRDREVGLGAA